MIKFSAVFLSFGLLIDCTPKDAQEPDLSEEPQEKMEAVEDAQEPDLSEEPQEG